MNYLPDFSPSKLASSLNRSMVRCLLSKRFACLVIVASTGFLLLGCTPAPDTAEQIQDSGSRRSSSGRMGAASAVANGKVYLLGGMTASYEVPGDVQEYDPQTKGWSFRSNMPTARIAGAAASAEGRIFFVGGRTGTEPQSAAVESFDPLSNEWKGHAPMPTARWNLMTVAVESRIYTFGGIIGKGDQRRVVGAVEVYDPQADKWTALPSMPTARSTAKAVAIGNSIYILGGRLRAGRGSSGTRGVDVYDTVTGEWSKAAPIGQIRTAPAVCVHGNRIFLVGGAGGGKVLASTKIYDAQLDQWSSGPQLQSPRGDGFCAVIAETMLVLGGYSAPNFSSLLGTVEEFSLKEP